MSTRFFTNKDENTLLNKFKGIFEHSRVSEFDALVGFFRSSGYFSIREHLKDVERIRILVGIDVDHLISEAAKQGLEFNFNAEATQEEFVRELRHDIERSNYDKKVEDGIIQFITDIVTGKIIIKAHPDKNIHAKIYIFRPKPFNEHSSGSVITGSSNLSISGLKTNFEFNVELRDYDDVAFATETFDKLWLEAIDILPNEVERLKETTFLGAEVTPFEVYIKFLMEYFGKAIEYDPDSAGDMPVGYKALAYQTEAVSDGFRKLMKYNGFILADVVGLGKTIVASIIAKKFSYANGYGTRILVVHPPAMKDSWEKTIKDDFNVMGVTLISNGSLHKVKNAEVYDLIIVDEAHKFRSDGSIMFHELQRVCKTRRKRKGSDGSFEKKVMLVTATPLNNRPEDIRNLLYLFQDAKRSTLEVGNIQHFFRPLIERYDKAKKLNSQKEIAREVKAVYDKIRTDILEPIIIRRTRTDIRETPDYWQDMIKQGLTFPDVEPPKKILYQLDNELDNLYDLTIQVLNPKKNGLGYYRYQAIRYLKPDPFLHYQKMTGVNVKQAERISEQLATIMKTLLVKRIDSSFYAFKNSVTRYRNANKAMLKMLNSNRVFLAPNIDVNSFIAEGREEELEKMLLEEGMESEMLVFPADAFNDLFVNGLKRDMKLLDTLVEDWAEVDYDPKYDEFLLQLKQHLFNRPSNPTGKLVVFSESKETTDHICGRLRKDGFNRLMQVDGSNRDQMRDVVRRNFDANCPINEQHDDFDIIFTTEVLAEGVNLHRSNSIVNYDIPWNATRLMQRIGRVNRIGSKADRIFIYNFFPTSRTDSEIELNKKAFMKLQAFHNALGEDSQIYSDEEEYGSFGLFERMPAEERDERLQLLMELREFRERSPEEYERIRTNVPLRARVGRKDVGRALSTIAYVKDKKRDAFYYVKEDLDLQEVTFVQAANVFRASVTERAKALHHLHYDQIANAVASFRGDQLIKALGDRSIVTLGPNETKAHATLAALGKFPMATDDDREIIRLAQQAIRQGRFQKLPREVNALCPFKKLNEEPSVKLRTVVDALRAYPLIDKVDEFAVAEPQMEYGKKRDPRQLPPERNDLPRVIISESFNG
jgi:superfamily II DNA or RNA helicase